MNIVIVPDAAGVHRAAADLFQSLAEKKSAVNAVMAVGNTPMGMYDVVAGRIREGLFDPSALRIFQLDDYAGLDNGDERSLETWLRRSVTDPWGIPEERIVTFGAAGDKSELETVCRKYENKARETGGYDIAVLGLGPNGHLGFNEPPSGAKSPTRPVKLTPESIRSNAGYWGGEERVPAEAITAGMDLLLAAESLILLVTGEAKRDILHRTVLGPVTADVPSSYVQLHAGATVIADRAAWSAGPIS